MLTIPLEPAVARLQLLRAWVGTRLDRFTVEGASPEIRRRSRVITAFVAILLLVVLICGPTDLINGSTGAAALEIAGVAIATVSLSWLKRGRVQLVGHLTTGLFVLVLVGDALEKGGLIAIEIGGQCAAILFAVLVLGPRGALVWTLVAIGSLVIHVRSFDSSPWRGRAVDLAHPVTYALQMAIIYLSVWGLAFAFDRVRADSLRRLEARNDEMRRVLEHSSDGLLTIDREGRIGVERSKRVAELLGDVGDCPSLWDVVARENPSMGRLLRLSWEAVLDDVIPRELALDQMPRNLSMGGRTFDLAFTVIEDEGAIVGALVVLHDITEGLAHERAEQAQRDLLAVFEHLRSDAVTVVNFVNEMDRLARSVVESVDGATVLRSIHTMKGSSALFGAQSLADLCHAVEERCAQAEHGPSVEDRALLAGRWSALSSAFREWINVMAGSDQVNVSREAVAALRAAVAARAPHAELGALIEGWDRTPLSRVFERLARHGQTIATRLGKDVDIVVEPSRIRVNGEALAPLFTALVHAVSNAVDHGIDPPEEREAAGKPRRGAIVLSARSRDAGLVIEIRDDGAGIDWNAVRTTAAARGLAHATEADLVAAILRDGFSTRKKATTTSGRGVGLAALRSAAEGLGGTVGIRSQPNRGSCVQVWVPSSAAARSEACVTA